MVSYGRWLSLNYLLPPKRIATDFNRGLCELCTQTTQTARLGRSVVCLAPGGSWSGLTVKHSQKGGLQTEIHTDAKIKFKAAAHLGKATAL